MSRIHRLTAVAVLAWLAVAGRAGASPAGFGAVVGHPTFGLDRPDIAGLFPNYANTHSAVGYLTIDTTTLTNGVHTIAWVVRDSLGRAQGLGSRYFTVQNP